MSELTYPTSRPRKKPGARRIPKATPWKRVEQRCKWVGDCFVWMGRVNHGGYGQVNIDDRTRSVHRLAYEHVHGPIPDGLTIDHVKARGCRFLTCCNAAHLEAVPIRTNLLRSDGPSAINARKTHCMKGHPLSGDNLLPYGLKLGFRECRLCNTERGRKRRLRLMAQATPQ